METTNSPKTERVNLLGQRLENLRKAKGLTARAVSRAVGVPESTYREWEYGRGLKLPPFQALSRILATPLTELVTGERTDGEEILNEVAEIEKRLIQLRLRLLSRF